MHNRTTHFDVVGLDQSVDILIDSIDVPHLFAVNIDEAFFALIVIASQLTDHHILNRPGNIGDARTLQSAVTGPVQIRREIAVLVSQQLRAFMRRQAVRGSRGNNEAR